MALNFTFQKGMTLLEVLVAMTLMVVISAIAFASLNGLIDAKNHTDIIAKNLRQEILTSQQLNKDFNAIINRPVKDGFGAQKRSITGDYANIEFSRNSFSNPLKQNRSELQRIRWYVQNNQLIRATLDQIDQGNFPQWKVRIYMDNIDSLAINYENRVGLTSRRWPIENNINPLKSIQFEILLNDGSSLKYLLSPLL